MSYSERITEVKDEIDALVTYANETTGEADTKIGDAVGHLVDGYGGGSSGATLIYETTFSVDSDHSSGSATSLCTISTGLSREANAKQGIFVIDLLEADTELTNYVVRQIQYVGWYSGDPDSKHYACTAVMFCKNNNNVACLSNNNGIYLSENGLPTLSSITMAYRCSNAPYVAKGTYRLRYYEIDNITMED